MAQLAGALSRAVNVEGSIPGQGAYGWQPIDLSFSLSLSPPSPTPSLSKGNEEMSSGEDKKKIGLVEFIPLGFHFVSFVLASNELLHRTLIYNFPGRRGCGRDLAPSSELFLAFSPQGNLQGRSSLTLPQRLCGIQFKNHCPDTSMI